MSRNGIDMAEVTLFALVPESRFIFNGIIPNGNNQISRIKKFIGWLSVEQTYPLLKVR
jgi:hypothetical protein